MNGHLNGYNEAYSDVLIIGAGISGINMAYRLQTQAPTGISYTILESRSNIGGTWDLFKYPGIRSDSDLYTFGFRWKPWNGGPIAGAPLILKYMHEAVEETGIKKHILLQHHVENARWSSEEQRWTLQVRTGERTKTFRTRFLIFSTGYCDYKTPLQAVIPSIDNFKGRVVHPQFWPEDLDYAGKDVAIIGSGATAITVFPNVAKTARRTTLVQRSPSYVFSLPNGVDPLTGFLRWLSPSIGYGIDRVKFLIVSYLFYYFCRLFPAAARSLLRWLSSKQLPSEISIDPHFNPRYNPWDHRVCFSPNGDFYAAMRQGRAIIETGSIQTVTKAGIRMENGNEIPADIIVTATGLNMKLAGGIDISIDGEPYSIPEKHLWKGFMLQDLPNAAFVIGYMTGNASWTLGADTTAQSITCLLNEMQSCGSGAVVPRLKDSGAMSSKPMLNLSST